MVRFPHEALFLPPGARQPLRRSPCVSSVLRTTASFETAADARGGFAVVGERVEHVSDAALLVVVTAVAKFVG